MGDAQQDLINYKGIYYEDDQGQKYTDPENGAHFEVNDLSRRLNKILAKIEYVMKQPSDVIEQQAQATFAIDPIIAHAQVYLLQKEKQALLKGFTNVASTHVKDRKSLGHNQQVTQQQMTSTKTNPIPDRALDYVSQNDQGGVTGTNKQQQLYQQDQHQQQQLYTQHHQHISNGSLQRHDDNNQSQNYQNQQQQQQQYQQQIHQQTYQQQINAQKLRSKSDDKTSSGIHQQNAAHQMMLTNSQKITKQVKAGDINYNMQQQQLQQMQLQQQQMMMNGGIQGQQLNLESQLQQIISRGKTPHNNNKSITKQQEIMSSGEKQIMNQTQQNIQKLKAQLGYNESIISAGANITMSNQNRSSQRSNRDNKAGVMITGGGPKNMQSSNMSQQVYNMGPVPATSQSRNTKNMANTFYNNMQNKSNTMNKPGMINLNTKAGLVGGANIDSLSFNNSLAIQNIGSYSLQNNMLIISSGKSRNINGNQFKTSASIGSTKGTNKNMGAIEGNHMLGSTFYAGVQGQSNNLIMAQGSNISGSLISNNRGSGLMDSIGSGNHTKNISGKFNQTIGSATQSKSLNSKQNMYSAIYNNNTRNDNGTNNLTQNNTANGGGRNLVSNYLKGVDQNYIKGSFVGSQKFVTTSSRNQGLAVPVGTKKQMTRNTIGGGGISGVGTMEMITNKSIVGNRYY